ncbi:MAG: hypothetical protein AMJ45_01020 [Syntrophobacter sp. DG_60]|nr:MAG: hypothetical protein AMJ45_01020 [Syntrophobacter sp. DG_60]
MQIIKELNLNIGGFYTAEIRERGQRKGFNIIDLGRKEGVLADIDLKSPYKVGKYKVNLKDLEEIGVKSILNAINENKIVIIDEIGKMELFSEKFRKAVEEAVNSKNKVLGTIKLTKDPFTEKIKNRKDTRIFHLTEGNFKQIKTEIIKTLRLSA